MSVRANIRGLLLSLTLLIAAPSIAFAGEVPKKGFDPLGEPWLSQRYQVSEADLQRLVTLAERDPVGASVLRQARQVLNRQTTSELLQIVSICHSAADNEGGEPSLGTIGGFEPKSVDELTGDRKEDHQANLLKRVLKEHPNAQILRVEDRPDYTQLVAQYRDGICLSPQLNVGQAVSTFIHELHHLTQMVSPDNELTFLRDFPDRDTYVRMTFEAHGSELQANAIDRGITVRIHGGDLKSLPPQERRYFDNKGELRDREGFAKYLLNNGYRKLLAGEYREKLEYFYRKLHSRQELLERLLKDRKNAAKGFHFGSTDRKIEESILRIQEELKGIQGLKFQYQEALAASR